MPMIVVPSASMNSFGAYEASVPNDDLAVGGDVGGTIAASASSFVGAGSALDAAAPADVGAADDPLPLPPAPHPARTAASAAQASAAGSWRGSDTEATSRWTMGTPGMLPLPAASGPPLCKGCY